jgi:predicted RNase H-like HicB family nuclease
MPIVETEREDDGRWIAEAPALQGVLMYGVTEADAIAKVKALARQIIVERIVNGEAVPRIKS